MSEPKLKTLSFIHTQTTRLAIPISVVAIVLLSAFAFVHNDVTTELEISQQAIVINTQDISKLEKEIAVIQANRESMQQSLMRIEKSLDALRRELILALKERAHE
ncbi:MAG: hypothetical protein HRU15_20240 [Planctomycetes bacterium]|nr:hypothetical protein [Planctomycetota bacterium]